ncbi:MAG: Dihydroneopterin aldolase [Actinomycetota bacterium]
MKKPMTGLDVITIHGVRGFGRHGLLESETIRGQEFLVDIKMWLRISKAAKTDDVAFTVDYAEVATAVHQHIVGEPVGLIETLAERIAETVLGFKRVQQVEVTIHKPHAPIPVDFQDVTLTITRGRL